MDLGSLNRVVHPMMKIIAKIDKEHETNGEEMNQEDHRRLASERKAPVDPVAGSEKTSGRRKKNEEPNEVDQEAEIYTVREERANPLIQIKGAGQGKKNPNGRLREDRGKMNTKERRLVGLRKRTIEEKGWIDLPKGIPRGGVVAPEKTRSMAGALRKRTTKENEKD